MELSSYVGLKVRIDLSAPQGFYYEGTVLNVDSESLTLRDRKGQLVTLRNSLILFIREVLK